MRAGGCWGLPLCWIPLCRLGQSQGDGTSEPQQRRRLCPAVGPSQREHLPEAQAPGGCCRGLCGTLWHGSAGCTVQGEVSFLLPRAGAAQPQLLHWDNLCLVWVDGFAFARSVLCEGVSCTVTTLLHTGTRLPGSKALTAHWCGGGLVALPRLL